MMMAGVNVMSGPRHDIGEALEARAQITVFT